MLDACESHINLEPMPRFTRQLLVSMVALCGCSSLGAHDFWLLAHPFEASGGAPVEISLQVGEHLVGQSQPNQLKNYVRFSYTHRGEQVDVPGERGRDPAGIIHDYDSSGFAVGYQSVRRFGNQR